MSPTGARTWSLGRVLLVLATGVPLVFLGICFFYPVLALFRAGKGLRLPPGICGCAAENIWLKCLGAMEAKNTADRQRRDWGSTYLRSSLSKRWV